MNFDSNKEKNLMNLNIMRCNKIIIKKVKTLIPLSSKNEKYFLKLTTNNDTPQISKIFSFKEISEIILNQSFSLETFQEKIIKEIKFEFINQDKNISVYSGSIINQNFIFDEKTGDNIIYLSDKKGMELLIIYYTIEYKAIDSFEFFDKSVKFNELANKDYLKKSRMNISQDESIKNEFIKNLIYIELIITYCTGLIKWKNNIETLLFLIVISFMILYFKFLYIYFLPLSIVFLHIRNKNKIKHFLNEKNAEENIKKGNLFFIKMQDDFNNIVENYELLIQKIMVGKKSNIIKIYKALILTVLSNIFLFYFKIFYLINWRKIFIIIIWLFFLSNNSFCIKLYYIMNELFSPFSSKLSRYSLIQKIKKIPKYIFNIFIPISSLYDSFTEENSETYISLVKSQGLKQNSKNILRSQKSLKKSIGFGNNLIKFELYENERWWVIAGWTKNLVGNRPNWCRVDKPMEFCDKTKIFLPDDEDNKYQWSADWKIEINDNTDENGWEYADDFESEFSKNEKFKYVRRRKWVRYANKI